jgi:hypothetical protein
MPARRQRLLDHGCPRFNLRLRISVTTAWPDLPISKSQQLRLAAFLKRNNFVGSSGFQSNHHHQPRGEWRAQGNLVLTVFATNKSKSIHQINLLFPKASKTHQHASHRYAAFFCFCASRLHLITMCAAASSLTGRLHCWRMEG